MLVQRPSRRPSLEVDSALAFALFRGVLVAGMALGLPSVARAQGGFDDEWENDFAEEEGADAGVADAGAGEPGEVVVPGDEQIGELPPETHDDTGDDLVPREEPWEREFRALSTIYGSSGGLHLVDAAGGPTGTFRLQLMIDFFATGNWLWEDDAHSRVGGALSIAGRVHDLVEVYGSLRSYASSNDHNRPPLFLVLGDVRAGVKVFGHATPWLSLGGALDAFLPTSGDLGVEWGAMGGSLTGLATADLRELHDPVPVIARFNIGYRVDNTAEIIRGLEDRRYLGLPDAFVPMEDESRNLATRFEKAALGVNRTDFLDIGLGVEAPLRLAQDLFVSPLIEWTWGIPINRQGYSCLFVPVAPGSSAPAEGEESCLDHEGLAAFPMVLTLGVRVHPVVRGFSAFIGVDIGLTGTSRETSVREVAMNAPYDVMFGASYAFDTRPPPDPEIIERAVDREVEIQDEGPPAGRVLGIAVTTATGAPIDEAIVSFPATPWSSILSGPDGRFTTYRFPPGTEVNMEVRAVDHDMGTCSATIPEDGADVQARCELDEHVLVQVEETEIIILEQINFAFDSDEILPSSFGLMDAIARVIHEHDQIRRIEIQGHTDDQGTDAYNDSLSQRRAESVRRGLIERGTEDERLSAVGYGERRPIVPNDTEENRAKNRRVQFIIQEQTQP